MDNDKLNMSLRRFLKKVGVTSQQEIEEAVRSCNKGSGKVHITAHIVAPDIGLDHVIEEKIDLG